MSSFGIFSLSITVFEISMKTIPIFISNRKSSRIEWFLAQILVRTISNFRLLEYLRMLTGLIWWIFSLTWRLTYILLQATFLNLVFPSAVEIITSQRWLPCHSGKSQFYIMTDLVLFIENFFHFIRKVLTAF